MDELTKKQKVFVKEYAKTENGTQAALKAYDTKDYSTAGAIASENLNKPKVIQALKSIADQIPDELLVKVHLEGLNATSGTGDKTQPDYGVRHKYLDTAHKLKGTYAPDKSINLNVEANITDPKARELAEKYENELKKGL